MSYEHPSDSPTSDIKGIQPTPSTDLGTMTYTQQSRNRARWILHLQAVIWRFLMGLGMMFHRMAPPRPPKPSFSRTVKSTVSGKPGNLTLWFYTPRDYETQRSLWAGKKGRAGEALGTVDEEGGEGSEGIGRKKRENSLSLSEMGKSIRKKSNSSRRWGSYPVVINFHGGGFTLGSALDDARWCGTVVDECNAVVISVDYRLAPECPFPTAVEDGVDAVLYVHRHAEELGIDKDKIALSGFSSGANMACTVPLRLYDEMMGFPRDEPMSRPPTAKEKVERAMHGVSSKLHKTKSNSGGSAASSSTRVAPESSNVQVLSPDDPPPPTPDKSTRKNDTNETVTEQHASLPEVSICGIIPWYPSLDYTRTREQRRATCKRKDQELPALFTNLFDDSYLHPPDTISLDSPYLSPGVAPTSLLRAALPQEIILHTCEWDMLLDEGEAFRERITGPEIGKNVWYKMVEGVPHGWDKAPNPLKPTPGVKEHYLRACKEMRRVFAGVGKEAGRPVPERQTTRGWPTTAPRESVSVVR